MFKKSQLEVKLLSDLTMYRMIQPNFSGGICYGCVRYAQPKNTNIIVVYDHIKINSFIMYIDAIIIYGWAMSLVLPKTSYAWCS